MAKSQTYCTICLKNGQYVKATSHGSCKEHYGLSKEMEALDLVQAESRQKQNIVNAIEQVAQGINLIMTAFTKVY